MSEPSKTTPKNSGHEISQFQIGMGCHDGTQYNFFAEGKVFSVRVIESRDVHHHSAWLYDDGIREVVNGDRPMDRVGDSHLNLEAPRFKIWSDDEQGSISAFAEDPADSADPADSVDPAGLVFQIDFKTPTSLDWVTPLGAAVIHQPLIRADIQYRGKTYPGIGYCKRYWFHEDTDYLAWRFIEGEVGDGRYMVWTADGNFGGDYQKYDYFKIAYANGQLSQAGDIESYHRDDGAYSTIDGVSYEVQIEALGTWSTVLVGEETRLKLRQRFCKLKILHDGQVDEGYAINETGTGAIR